MTKYATQPLTREQLLVGIHVFCEVVSSHGAHTAELSFGWDCNLEIEQMWQPIQVQFADLVEHILQAESDGTVVIGEGDIFVSVSGLDLTVCHESDLHLKGEGAQVNTILERWRDLRYKPAPLSPGTFS